MGPSRPGRLATRQRHGPARLPATDRRGSHRPSERRAPPRSLPSAAGQPLPLGGGGLRRARGSTGCAVVHKGCAGPRRAGSPRGLPLRSRCPRLDVLHRRRPGRDGAAARDGPAAGSDDVAWRNGPEQPRPTVPFPGHPAGAGDHREPDRRATTRGVPTSRATVFLDLSTLEPQTTSGPTCPPWSDSPPGRWPGSPTAPPPSRRGHRSIDWHAAQRPESISRHRHSFLPRSAPSPGWL